MDGYEGYGDGGSGSAVVAGEDGDWSYEAIFEGSRDAFRICSWERWSVSEVQRRVGPLLLWL